MSVAISVRIPDNLDKKLEWLVHETERSRSFHMQKALEAYLEDLADFQIAADRLHNPKDLIIPSKQFKKSLGL